MTLSTAAKTLLAAALFGATLVSGAAARDVFTARLVSPVAEPTRVIAQDTVWSCEGDTCVAAARHEASVRACRRFVREAGPVSAYGPAGGELSAEELARCNGDADQTQEAQAR